MVTNISKDHDLIFLNYGYINDMLNSSTLPLEPEDENNRNFIHLYHQVVSHVDLKGKDVLEISSGHGGGASYISRYLKPRSYTGLDQNSKAIEFCKNRHQVEGLSFVEGDAINIHLEDESIDVVVNVEASHVYPNPQKFFAGVARVLRPGGHFLTTDFRSMDKVQQWKDNLAASGMKIVREVDITQNVVDSMSELHEQRVSMINEFVPRLIGRWFKQFAGVKGSKIYENLRTGKSVYMVFALQKA